MTPNEPEPVKKCHYVNKDNYILVENKHVIKNIN